MSPAFRKLLAKLSNVNSESGNIRATAMYTEDVSLSNWALVFVGAAGVILAWRTLLSLIRQTRATETAANAAKVSADAMIASERAWIMVDLQKPAGGLFTSDSWSSDGKRHTNALVRCICSNQGKTPARVSEKRICMFLTNPTRPLPAEPNLEIEIRDAEPHYLKSGDEWVEAWDVVAEDETHLGDMVVIYGVVKYRHMFSDREVQTTFGYTVTEDNKLERLVGYGKYNENS